MTKVTNYTHNGEEYRGIRLSKYECALCHKDFYDDSDTPPKACSTCVEGKGARINLTDISYIVNSGFRGPSLSEDDGFSGNV